MSAKILDRLISAFVGAVSAVGTVWFLNANGPDAQSPPTASENAPVKFDRLEVDALRVNEVLFVADPQTNEPSIELRDGSISARQNVFAEQIGAFRVLGRKVQATPDDPLNAQSPVFAELATNQDGGAYLALLSPQETHSVTIGFDKTEKGCLVSQNNVDSSMIAQAIFVKPTADGVAATQAETPVETQTETPTAPLEAPLETPATEQAPQENAPLVPEVAPLPTPADASQLGDVTPAPGF
ncbi:MAG: hypothetical protein IJX36_02150 [Thermoguttaceae bacterium]|nr:hypothetical protein [Thermoguttaceae bacterium]MBQ9129029.1 hypothetical protein [Thermoguttaceae bacterium]